MIRLENISKNYADKTILSQVSYHFPLKERIALVGANGQGKTTLLRIILGLEENDAGRIIKPNDTKIVALPQSFNATPASTILLECMAGHAQLQQLQQQLDRLLEKMMQEYTEADGIAYENTRQEFEVNGGYKLEGNAQKVLLGLGFTQDQLTEDPKTLSGGWRMRLELAKVLVAEPDFLILDEPTNHLDLPSVEWLEEYLTAFPGTLVFVSHDRAFLNALSTITLYLNHGNLTPYTGNFDSFLAQRDQDAQHQAAAVKKLQRQKTHMQSFVDRFKAKASKAAQARSRMKMVSKLQETLDNLNPEQAPPRMRLPKLPLPTSGKQALAIKKLNIGYDAPLVRSINLLVDRGDKIAIVGANGRGKSTFLKTIYGNVEPLAGSISVGHNVQMGFFTQDAADALDKKSTVYETLRNKNPEITEQTCRAMLGAFLFKGNALSKKVAVLSGGERSRLALCCLLAKYPNFLLLDEPTNHLDMISTEVLVEMLQDYEGTFMLVSHDRYFVEQVATSMVEFTPEGKILQY